MPKMAEMVVRTAADSTYPEVARCYSVRGGWYRVIGSTYVPKSAIANITVYTGGIPANYGDFTGGVIEITTGDLPETSCGF